MFNIGREFRNRYIDDPNTSVLPDLYDPFSMSVDTLSVNTTLQSASSFLLGLYPLGKGPSLREDYNQSLSNPPYNITAKLSWGPTAATPFYFQIIPTHSTDLATSNLMQPTSACEPL